MIVHPVSPCVFLYSLQGIRSMLFICDFTELFACHSDFPAFDLHLFFLGIFCVLLPCLPLIDPGPFLSLVLAVSLNICISASTHSWSMIRHRYKIATHTFESVQFTHSLSHVLSLSISCTCTQPWEFVFWHWKRYEQTEKRGKKDMHNSTEQNILPYFCQKFIYCKDFSWKYTTRRHNR